MSDVVSICAACGEVMDGDVGPAHGREATCRNCSGHGNLPADDASGFKYHCLDCGGCGYQLEQCGPVVQMSRLAFEVRKVREGTPVEVGTLTYKLMLVNSEYEP